MFPIYESTLSFAEISDYWAAELNISWEKVEALLESAWWLGEILGVPGPPTRLALLKSLFKRMRDQDPPRLLFITPDSKPPAKIVEQPDKSLLINLRPDVPVPSDDLGTWSVETCGQAFGAMAKIPSSEYYPEYLPGFAARKLASDEFFQWILKRRFKPPDFWEQTNDKVISPQLKQAPVKMIEGALRHVYDIAEKQGNKPPNIKEVAKPVLDYLQKSSHKATAAKIQEIGNSREFKQRRRPPGKTLKSEKGGPRK